LLIWVGQWEVIRVLIQLVVDWCWALWYDFGLLFDTRVSGFWLLLWNFRLEAFFCSHHLMLLELGPGIHLHVENGPLKYRQWLPFWLSLNTQTISSICIHPSITSLALRLDIVLIIVIEVFGSNFICSFNYPFFLLRVIVLVGL